MDAMSEAVDNAAVLCYGVSAACERYSTDSVYVESCSVLTLQAHMIGHLMHTDKESANCRLEAQVREVCGAHTPPECHR